jgi:dienelactone hydrolase
MPHAEMARRVRLLAVLVILAVPVRTMSRTAEGTAETVVIESGPLQLHGLLWRPAGSGMFPAVLFNHGSYGRSDAVNMEQVAALGTVFTRHGYVFLVLFRRGVGPSSDQGAPEGELMNRGLAIGGPRSRNRVQLELLEGESLREGLAGVAFLKGRPEVDARRVAVGGHSFGGSLALLVAAHEPTVRAVALFASAARSWDRSPELRARLFAAARRTTAPVLFMHASNDYSTAPGTSLAAERRKLGLPQRLKIYPPFGSTPSEGHNVVYLSISTWESDLFTFLDDSLGPTKPPTPVPPQ